MRAKDKTEKRMLESCTIQHRVRHQRQTFIIKVGKKLTEQQCRARKSETERKSGIITCSSIGIHQESLLQYREILVLVELPRDVGISIRSEYRHSEGNHPAIL